MDAQEQRQFATLVQAVLALQEAERKWGPGDLTVLQAKERLFDMVNNIILVQETGVEPVRERDAMRAREAEPQRQKQREQDRDPDQLRQLEPQESQALSTAEVIADHVEYTVIETPVGDAVPHQLEVAVMVIRAAMVVYRERERFAHDLEDKFERLLDAASDLAGELAHKARSVGLDVGEALGRAEAQVAGEADGSESARLAEDLAKSREMAERLATKLEAKAEREADLDLRAVGSAQVDQVEQQRRPPQRDGGIEIGGP